MTTQPATRQTVRVLPLDKLQSNPHNIRDEHDTDLDDLAASIREHGVIEPLIVTEAPGEYDVFTIIAGHRRAAAAKRAGHRAVPCVIRHEVDDVGDQVVLMLVENLQREDLGPVEKAEAFGGLRRRGLSANEIARRVGITQGTVSYFLALLELDKRTLEDVRAGRVTVTAAIGAVRDTRAARRETNGSHQVGRPTVLQPAHFAKSHPLAPTWRARCHHTTRPQLAGGCGQCIEAAIRADERSLAEQPNSTEEIPA